MDGYAFGSADGPTCRETSLCLALTLFVSAVVYLVVHSRCRFLRLDKPRMRVLRIGVKGSEFKFGESLDSFGVVDYL